MGGVLAALLLAGCRQGAEIGTTATAATPHIYLDHAQPKLPVVDLWLGDQVLHTEVARRQVELATGMMFRTNMAENAAMLFVFPEPEQASFYMKNTKLPLSCAYIAPDGTILELHNLKPEDETAVTAASDNVQYVLETNQGWFHRHNITVGAIVRTSHGPLADFDWVTLRPR